MILYERSGIAEIEGFLIEAVKNQLWMEVGGRGGHEAYCKGTSCESSELFNFMGGYMDPHSGGGGHVTERVDALIASTLPGGDDTGPVMIGNEDQNSIMSLASEWGSYVTAYDSSRVTYNGDVPYGWGNKTYIAERVLNVSPGFNYNQIVFSMEGFYIYTMNQSNYWGEK
jgi:hypothetical protein